MYMYTHMSLTFVYVNTALIDGDGIEELLSWDLYDKLIPSNNVRQMPAVSYRSISTSPYHSPGFCDLLESGLSKTAPITLQSCVEILLLILPLAWLIRAIFSWPEEVCSMSE